MIPNYQASIDFLGKLRPGGPWVLTAITLDKKGIETATHRDPAKVLEWLEQHGADRNIYYALNPLLQDVASKAAREDVASMAFLHVDLDPRVGVPLDEERTRLLGLLQNPPAGIPRPTIIVDSGGGYQGMWQLFQPFAINGEEEKYRKAAEYNYALELAFGADATHNVDRVLRLPGTINRPDRIKEKKGRKEALATVVEWQASHFSIDDFKAQPLPIGEGGSAAIVISDNPKQFTHDDVGTLPVSDLCKVVIVWGYDPDTPDRWPSRSEPLHFVCCDLARGGCDNDTIYSVISNPEFGISASVLDKGRGAAGYAKKQIARARAKVAAAKRPIQLPSGHYQHRDTALALAPLVQWYQRDRVLFSMSADGKLVDIRACRAVTLFEQVATFYAKRTDAKGNVKETPIVLQEPEARLIINCDDFINHMREIRIVADCPVLKEVDGKLVEIVGYDATTGIYAKGEAPEPMGWEQGRDLLLDLFHDYKFTDEGDKARLFIGILSPAMNTAGLLGNARVPMLVLEADHSQAGKSLAVRCIAAIYGSQPKTIGAGGKGVGSLRESMDKEIINGSPFVSFDNIRGLVNEPDLEKALTEPVIVCRVPYHPPISVDPRGIYFTLTSNKAELTTDLANRSNIVRIQKQPDAYQFRRGDLWGYVRANQRRFLGAVWAVLREWYARGKPLADDIGGHDFRLWARAARYIAQEIGGLADPIKGYRNVQARTASHDLNWLREIALAVREDGRLHEELRAADLLDIAIDHEIGLPVNANPDGTDDEAFRRAVLQAIGRRLGAAFKPADDIIVDDLIVHRSVSAEANEHGRYDKTYRVSPAGQGEPF